MDAWSGICTLEISNDFGQDSVFLWNANELGRRDIKKRNMQEYKTIQEKIPKYIYKTDKTINLYNKYDRELIFLTKIPYKSNFLTQKWAKSQR